MPKLPAVKPKQIIAVLKKLGFLFHRSKGSHLSFYHPFKNLTVVISFHNQDLPKDTLLSILSQADISKEQLTKLL